MQRRYDIYKDKLKILKKKNLDFSTFEQKKAKLIFEIFEENFKCYKTSEGIKLPLDSQLGRFISRQIKYTDNKVERLKWFFMTNGRNAYYRRTTKNKQYVIVVL